MQYDFDTLIDRQSTGSLKWDRFQAQHDAQGREVLPLWVADMDFVSAPEILNALRSRVDHGVFGYTVPDKAVEAAVLDYLSEQHGYQAQPNWLHFIHGCVPALNVFARAVGEPGDAIMTCTPVYPPFLSAPGWQGRQLITSHLKHDGSRWTFDWDDMASKVTPRTKGFILCNPHNPVGRVYTVEELERLAEFCLKHNLILCSDEIHCDLCFEGSSHHMTATLSEDIAQQCVTLHAPSKTYNLPGLSCAYAVISHPKLRAQFAEAARGFVTEVNALGYAGMMAAYQHGEPWRRNLMGQLTRNRDFLYAFTAAKLSPYLVLEQPMEATYLAWLNARGLKQAGIENPQTFLLQQAGVGLSPGSDFGDADYVRLNFGCPLSRLQEALERIHAACESLS